VYASKNFKRNIITVFWFIKIKTYFFMMKPALLSLNDFSGRPNVFNQDFLVLFVILVDSC